LLELPGSCPEIVCSALEDEHRGCAGRAELRDVAIQQHRRSHP
jgi:hypothetical protein